jgi:hypothetical protein
MMELRNLAALACMLLAFSSRAAGADETPAPRELSADDIFARARAVAAQRTLPPYLQYRLDGAFEHRGKIERTHFRVTLRTSDGKAYVEPLQDSPRDRLDTTPYVADGPPYVWPARTFGLIPPTHAGSGGSSVFEEAAPSPSPSLEPGTIGRVTAIRREYDVTLVGMETVDGATVYHLHLVPRIDPDTQHLRELYVDTTTFQTVREELAFLGVAGPVRVHPHATLDYVPFGSGWIIASGSGDFTARFGFFSYAGTIGMKISDVSAPANVPATTFDAPAGAEGRRDRGPNAKAASTSAAREAAGASRPD